MVTAMLRRFDSLGPWTDRLRGGRAWLLGGAVAAVAVIAATSALLLDRTSSDDAMAIARDGGAAVGSVGRAASGAANEAAAPAPGLPYDLAQSQAAPDAKGGETSSGVTLPSQAAGRTLIRSGSVEMTVRSVPDAFEQVRQLATQVGGFVADSTLTGSSRLTSEPRQPELGAAYLTLRVPAERFDDVVAQLRGMAVEVQTASTASRDVTEEVSDLEATLRNLRAVESQYITLLGRATNVGEILQVQERLNQVRLQIDRTEARRTLLTSQAEMSTLSVTLRPETAAANNGDGLRGAAQDAWDASLRSIEAVATAALVAVVYSWWLVVPAAVALLFLRRRFRRTAATSA